MSTQPTLNLPKLSAPVGKLHPRLHSNLQPLAVEARMLFDGAGAVVAVNHDPIAVADCRALPSDSSICDGQVIAGNTWGDAADCDIDGDTLRVAGIDKGDTGGLPQGHIGQTLQGEHGNITMQADGSYCYTPNADLALQPGQTVTDTFTYTLCDNRGGESVTTLTLTLCAPANHDPLAMPDARTLSDSVINAAGNVIGDGAAGDQADSDIDCDALIVCGVTAGNSGEASRENIDGQVAGAFGSLTMQANGCYTYTRYADTPVTAGQQGIDVFTYTLCDQRGGLSTTTLSFVIEGAPIVIVVGTDGGDQPSGGNAGTGGDKPVAGNGATITSSTSVDSKPSPEPPATAPAVRFPSNPVGNTTDPVVVTEPEPIPRIVVRDAATLSSAFAPVLLSQLSAVRPATSEVTRLEMPRDSFAPFSPERVLGEIQEAPAEPAKTAAIAVPALDEKNAKDDCISSTKPVAEKIKPKAVKPSVFAKPEVGLNRGFSEQLKVAKKAFKPPVQVRPAALAKDC